MKAPSFKIDIDFSEPSEKVYQEERSKFVLLVKGEIDKFLKNEINVSFDEYISGIITFQFEITKGLIEVLSSSDGVESFIAGKLLDDLDDIMIEATKKKRQE